MNRAGYMKEFGRMIKDTNLDLNYLQVEIHTKENILMARLMEKVYIIGSTEKHIKVNFSKEWSKATDFGKEQNRIHI